MRRVNRSKAAGACKINRKIAIKLGAADRFKVIQVQSWWPSDIIRYLAKSVGKEIRISTTQIALYCPTTVVTILDGIVNQKSA
jgi:hypothetical protein